MIQSLGQIKLELDLLASDRFSLVSFESIAIMLKIIYFYNWFKTWSDRWSSQTFRSLNSIMFGEILRLGLSYFLISNLNKSNKYILLKITFDLNKKFIKKFTLKNFWILNQTVHLFLQKQKSLLIFFNFITIYLFMTINFDFKMWFEKLFLIQRYNYDSKIKIKNKK
jgi:hypothetical protein